MIPIQQDLFVVFKLLIKTRSAGKQWLFLSNDCNSKRPIKDRRSKQAATDARPLGGVAPAALRLPATGPEITGATNGAAPAVTRTTANGIRRAAGLRPQGAQHVVAT
jgi:hypothetical protein